MRATNIAQMQSQEQAYGQRLSTGKMLGIISPFFICFGAYTFLLTLNPWAAVIVTLIAILFGRYSIVPREVNARYYRTAMEQRHSFMDTVTQVFGEGNDPSVNVLTALNSALEGRNIWGEFRQDIEQLISAITEDNAGAETRQVFSTIRKKYREDIWFTEFMEQLQTTNETGHINADAFHDIYINADALFHNQELYIAARRAKSKYEYWIIFAIVPALLVVFHLYGMDNYSRIFAHTGFGWIYSFLYLMWTWFLLHLLYKYNYDESLTTV